MGCLASCKRYPHVHVTLLSGGFEIRTVLLELRRAGKLVFGFRQPVIENREERLMDRRDVALVSKNHIVLPWHPEIPKSRRKTVNAGHLCAGNVLKTTVQFRITTQAIAPAVYLI